MSTLPKDLAFDCIVVCEAAAAVFDTAKECDWCRAVEELSGYVVRNRDMLSVRYLQTGLLDTVGRLASIQTDEALEVAGEMTRVRGQLQTRIGVGLVGRTVD